MPTGWWRGLAPGMSRRPKNHSNNPQFDIHLDVSTGSVIRPYAKICSLAEAMGRGDRVACPLFRRRPGRTWNGDDAHEEALEENRCIRGARRGTGGRDWR